MSEFTAVTQQSLSHHCLACLNVSCTIVQLQLTTMHFAQPLYGDKMNLSVQQLSMYIQPEEGMLSQMLTFCVWVLLGSANLTLMAAEAWTLWTSRHGIH